MSDREIVIGSRGSALALAQARLVGEALERHGHRTGIAIIETEGDRRAPDTAWGEGAFVAAIERALLDGRVDVAVHSAKDVPTDEDPRLLIAAYLARADPRDALVLRTDASERSLADLPAGFRVGTDSPRRSGFLLARRPDLALHPLHGNVDTRLRRLDAGETDALVLACAGLDRMSLGHRIVERLDPAIVPPAPGQGAIAVQVRAGDPRMLALVAAIDNRPTRQAVEAERAFLRESGGGCRAPIGALATIAGGEVDLLGGWASVDGSRAHFAHRRGPVGDGEDLARELAAELGWLGDEARRASAARVLVTRATEQAGDLVAAMRDVGLEPIEVPAIKVEIDPPGGQLDSAARLLPACSWVVVTSTNGARAILRAAERVRTELRAPSWAAIGSATSAILERAGIEVRFQPNRSSALALAAELPVSAGDRILVVRGDLADGSLAIGLRARGAHVDDVVAYRTREAPESSRKSLRQAIAGGPIAAAVFTSGSTVRGLLSLGAAESVDVRAIPAVCIGPETADEARAAGFHILATSPTTSAVALAAATADAIVLQRREAP
jgi:hydroxymethylbilane synthase